MSNKQHRRVYTDCFELLGFLNKIDDLIQQKNYKEAFRHYIYVIEGYKVLANREKNEDSKKKLLLQVEGFVVKAKEVRSLIGKTKKSTDLPKAKKIHKLAYEADKKKDYRVALKYYLKCSEYYMKHVHNEKGNQAAEKKYTAVITKILERADLLKKSLSNEMEQIQMDFQGLLKLNPKQFTFQSEVGKGSYGTVKKMRMKLKSSEVVVAVKEFKLQTKLEAQSIENEIRIMKKLKHKNIVRIFGYYQEDDKFNLVMEFMSGGDLYKFIRSKPLSNYDKWEICRMVVEAVHYLHQSRIIHRDLKSLNYLVSYNQRSVKLSDFGISTIKLNTIAPGASGAKKADVNLGTSRFMAPEIIITKEPHYSTKSDIYALGMTIFEIVTGKVPFENQKDDTSVLCMVKYEDQRPSIPEITPAHFKYMMELCWKKDPKDRPEASQLIEFMNVNSKEFLKWFPESQSVFFAKKRRKKFWRYLM